LLYRRKSSELGDHGFHGGEIRGDGWIDGRSGVKICLLARPERTKCSAGHIKGGLSFA
jgi:hypothetical protein